MKTIQNLKSKTLVLLALLAAALPAMAGSYSGTIVAVDARASGLTVVTMSGTTGHGACSASPSALWAIKDETSVAGKNQIGVLLGAYLTGRTITVYGVNTCARQSGIEDLDEVTAF